VPTVWNHVIITEKVCVRKRSWPWHLPGGTEETHRSRRQSEGRYLNRGPYRTQSRYADHSTANFGMTKCRWINACVTMNALHAAHFSCEVTVAGLIKKLSEFHWARKFITLFTRTISGPYLDLNYVHTFMPCFFLIDIHIILLRGRKYFDMMLQGYGTVNTRWRH
jgi:hypothetical protein